MVFRALGATLVITSAYHAGSWDSRGTKRERGEQGGGPYQAAADERAELKTVPLAQPKTKPVTSLGHELVKRSIAGTPVPLAQFSPYSSASLGTVMDGPAVNV